MKTTRICLGCGMPLPPDAPGGLCPQCLLKSDAGSPRASEGVRAVPIPGSTFGGYRIIRLLGQGGMGEVYEAEHITDARRVALKVMSHELGSEQDRKRFLREGRLAASVNHPNAVYVFGSEEIDGVPVIAMELVRGGTLRDRLKTDRYLPVSEAVEAALQIIDGLESANAAGVLHRDIKPANCFVDAEGAVKVGDFGLSVSTLARGESLLTAKGSVLGTPAYASPEQLRGEELDVRSDIYSVGATLYHLLTGRTPFEAQDFVKLITEVLDKTPATPQALRSEIPGELSRVVLRCLAKDRKDRFQTYAELRNALLPFRAAEVAPANPARRFLAGLIDDMIAYGPCLLFSIYWSTGPLEYFVRERTITSALVWLAFYGVYACYYTVGEGLFGGALGKTLCGLRVVGPDRQLPGIGRAFARVVLYMSTFAIPPLALLALSARHGFRPEMIRSGESLIDWLWIPLWLALFVTMRRSNGYAALHDLLTGTRVIIRPRTEPRPVLGLPALPPMSEPSHQAFGPYSVRGAVWNDGSEQLLLAADTTLNRNVWIHVRRGSEGLSAARRELSRPARLRWLTGGTHAGERWDAYEAINGQPLLELSRKAISWNALRFWLLDLAEELAAGSGQPATAAPFALDRIWISSSGRAVLLDFPSRCGSPVDEPTAVMDVAQMQKRLQEVVDASIGKNGDDTGPLAPQVPLHAQSFLTNLERGSFEKPEFVVGNLHSLASKRAEIGRAMRAASLILLPAVLLMLTVTVAGIVNFEQVRFERAWQRQYPGKPSLFTATRLHELTRELRGEDRATDRDVKLVRVFIAHHLASVITNDTFWNDPDFALILSADDRSKLQKIVADYSAVSATDLAEAERVVPPKMREQERINQLMPLWILLGFAVTLVVMVFAFVALVCAFFQAVPTLNLFGIAVVDRSGRAASRWRLLIRWTAVWLPTIIMLCAVAALISMTASLGTPYDEIPARYHSLVRVLTLAGTPLALVFWLWALIYAALHPNRGFQDRLAGTWLVPK